MNAKQLLNPPTPPKSKRTELAAFRRSISKEDHVSMRDRCLEAERLCKERHMKEYRKAAKAYGIGWTMGVLDKGEWMTDKPTHYVSGGIWEHWPREVKNSVARWIRTAPTWNDLARMHHKAAGKTRWTFPRSL